MDKYVNVRSIAAERERTFKSTVVRWESLLVLMFIAVNIMNICISPNYLKVDNLFTAISNFLVKGFIAFPMAFILVIGEIDLSVGATVALSATLLGVSYNGGLPMGLAVLIALVCGLCCGLLNGVIMVSFPELAPMIVTLGTQTLYRGITQIILGSESTGNLHNVQWFYNLYYSRIGSVPVILFVFFLLAIVFGFVLHKTVFGRYLYAIGSNRVAAGYACVPVKRVRLICYALTGLISALAAVYYASWTGSIRSDIGAGYELEAISMVVLGGISTAGGKGNFPGTVISIFTIGLLRYGLGLVNMNSQTILMIIGAILIIVVMLPNIIAAWHAKKSIKRAAV